MKRQDWLAAAKVSREVADHAITEREAALELGGRTGGDPRSLVRVIRAGVKLFEGSARCPRYAAGLEREVRRMREARSN